MPYEEIEPTETKDRDGDTRLDHPAFGQISAHRRQGSVNLYGSDFTNHSSICIRISTSQLFRGLSHDRYYPDKVISEVVVSEAQWATFVSSLNSGEGVPATIRFSEKVGERPGIVLRQTAGLFKKEGNERIQNVLKELEALRAKLDDATSGMSKTKAAVMRAHIDKAHQEIGLNLDFVAESFGKHLEDTIEEAKIEVEAYVTHRVQRAGLDALSGPTSPVVPSLPGQTKR